MSGGISVHSQIAVVFDGPIDPASIADAIQLAPPVSGSISLVALPDDSHPAVQPHADAGRIGRHVLVFTPERPARAAHDLHGYARARAYERTDGQVAAGQTWTFITGEPSTNALNQIAFMSNRSGVNNVWLMNPDGSNQREVTSELVPVSGYDISGDGTTIAYAAGGVVKKMSIGGDTRYTLTAGGTLRIRAGIHRRTGRA